MTDFTRLTVIGTLNKAELVLPSEEPFAGLMPRLMGLLAEPSGSIARPLALVRSTGEQLDLGLSAAQQLVLDGELLHLSRIDDAPAPPEVSDVTDAVADALRTRGGLWGERSRHAVAAVAIAFIAVIAGGVALPLLTSSLPAAGTLLPLAIAWPALLVTAVLLGRAGLSWAGTATTAAALGLSLPLASALLPVAMPALDESGTADPTRFGALIALAITLAWFSIAAGFGIGQRRRAALAGSLLGVALLLVPLLLLALGVDPLGALGIGGVVAALASGVVPWFALAAAGLTGLDDEVVAGRLRSRRTVLSTADEAYRTLSWSTVAAAIVLALCGIGLVASANGWAIGLGAALALTAALRTRAFSVAIDAIALWTASALIAVSAFAAHAASGIWLALAALIVAAVLVAIAAGVRPAAHTRATLRRFGNTIESLAVVSTVPLLLGVFGLYAQLLETF